MFRRLVNWLNGQTGRDLEYESRHWHLVCTVCGHARSYWDLGGVRYRATGTGRSVSSRCAQCNETRRFKTQWLDPPPGEN